jgi:iodotyrosine deiodinase
MFFCGCREWRDPDRDIVLAIAQPFRTLVDGTRSPTYHAIESVGIATGLLVTAMHSCGLVALTHTPSAMGLSQ